MCGHEALIEELRGEIAYLKSELGLCLAETEQAKLMLAFNLSPCVAKFLMVLYQAKGAPRSTLYLDSAIPPKDHARDRDIAIVAVWACHLRRKMGKDTVANLHGVGYCLTPKGLAAVASVLSPPAEEKKEAA